MLNALSLVLLSLTSLAGAATAVAAALGQARGLGVPLLARAVRASAALLAVGAIAVVLSFGRPELFLSVLTNPDSGIFRVFAALSAALLLLTGSHRLLRHGAFSPGPVKILLVLAALSAALELVATGAVLVMPWRTGWHTTAIALPAAGWLPSASATVLVLLLVLEARREGFENPETVVGRARAARGAALLLPAPAAAILVMLLRMALGDAPSPEPTVPRLLSGDLAVPFWSAVLTGLVLPPVLLLPLVRRLERSVPDSPVRPFLAAALCSLALECAGLALFEWCVLSLGSTTAWSFFS